MLPRAPTPHFGEGRQLAICQIRRCTLLPPPSSLPLAPPAFYHLPPRNQQLPPTCPMAALCSGLAGVAERLNPGSNARERERATPARRAPGSRRPAAPGEAARKASQEGGARRHLCAAGYPSPHPARALCSPASGACTHQASGPPSRPTAGGRGPLAGSSWALKG